MIQNKKKCFRQRHWIEQSIKNILDDPENEALTFVTENDIKGCLDDSQIFVLEAPLGTEIALGAIPNKVNNYYNL